MPGYKVIRVEAAFRAFIGEEEESTHIAAAVVCVRKPDGSEETALDVGIEMVDAVLNAIQQALGICMELVSFVPVVTVCSGEEEWKVVVQIRDNGSVYEGAGLGTEISVATAEAFIDALNRRDALEAAVVVHTV